MDQQKGPMMAAFVGGVAASISASLNELAEKINEPDMTFMLVVRVKDGDTFACIPPDALQVNEMIAGAVATAEKYGLIVKQ